MFNIFVNDIPSVVQYSKIVIHADDARLYVTGDVVNAKHKLTSDLVRVSQWASEWQLKLNIKKCAVMHMGYNNPNFVYAINNVDVNVVSEMNDLGITEKNSLHLDSYINTMVGIAYRLCNNIFKCFYTQFPDFLTSLFKTYVSPLLECNSVIWSPASLMYVDKCERAQRYFTKRLSSLWNLLYLTRL